MYRVTRYTDYSEIRNFNSARYISTGFVILDIRGILWKRQVGWVKMASTELVLEIVDVLRKRREILACLLDDPRDKSTLVDELDIPRSTLDRAVRELESVRVVTYSDGEYVVTGLGERLTRDFFRFVDRAELALELEPFLRWAPSEEFELDIRWLADAELLGPTDADPYAMINRHMQRLKEMDYVRGMLPVTGLHAHEAAHESIVENGAEGKLIVEPDVAEVLTSKAPFADLTEEMLATDRFELFVCDDSIPYFVGVFDDDIVQIGVDENGEPRAMIEADHPEVRTWAVETLNEYERRAERLSSEAAYDVRRSVTD